MHLDVWQYVQELYIFNYYQVHHRAYSELLCYTNSINASQKISTIKESEAGRLGSTREESRRPSRTSSLSQSLKAVTIATTVADPSHFLTLHFPHTRRHTRTHPHYIRPASLSWLPAEWEQARIKGIWYSPNWPRPRARPRKHTNNTRIHSARSASHKAKHETTYTTLKPTHQGRYQLWMKLLFGFVVRVEPQKSLCISLSPISFLYIQMTCNDAHGCSVEICQGGERPGTYNLIECVN